MQLNLPPLNPPTMLLHNHEIDDRLVGNISELHEEQHPNEAEALGNGSARWYYHVHLFDGSIITIHSPWFHRTDRKQRKAMRQWKHEYRTAVDIFLHLPF